MKPIKGNDKIEWCPVVQGWMKRGFFDLAELEQHVAACPICQRLMATTEKSLQDALGEAGLYEAEE